MKKPPLLQLVKLCCLLFSLLFLGARGAEAGFQPDLMVKFASDDDASYLGRGVFESTAKTQSKGLATLAGTTAVYRVLLQNAGDAEDRYTFTGTASGSGFTVQYLDSAGIDRTALVSGAGLPVDLLPPGGSASLLVRVTPTVATLGASYRVSVTATSVSQGTKTDQIKTETVICSANAAVIVSVPPDSAGMPGKVVNYPYTVTNVGSGVNTFNLVPANTAGWTEALYADDGAGGGIAGDGIRQSGETTETTSTGPLQPGASYRFFLAVTVPPSSIDGSNSETRLTVAGTDASTADRVTTTATAATVTIAEDVRNITQGGPFEAAVSASPGDMLEYRMSIINSGQGPATLVSVDTPLPQSMAYVPGTLKIATTADGDGDPCPVARCGWARQAGGTIIGRLGEGATDASGGQLPPGRSLYLFFRMQVE